MNLTGVKGAKLRTPKGATTNKNAAAGLFYFWPRWSVTPDKRYEHPLLLAPATREPPDSGKTGLAKFAFCLLLFVFLKGVLAHRKPTLLLRLSASLLLR